MGTTTTFGWPTPNDTDYVAQGYAAIDALGDAIDVTLNVVTGSTGSGDVPKLALDLVTTATIGTAVSSVTVNNCFSSKYDAYRIVISGGGGSVAGGSNMNLKLGSSAANYYGILTYAGYNGTTLPPAGNNPNNSFFEYVGHASTNYIGFDVDLVNPFLAKFTSIKAPFYAPTAGGAYYGLHQVASSFTSFTIGCALGTLSGGTIRVYGYRNS